MVPPPMRNKHVSVNWNWRFVRLNWHWSLALWSYLLEIMFQLTWEITSRHHVTVADSHHTPVSGYWAPQRSTRENHFKLNIITCRTSLTHDSVESINFYFISIFDTFLYTFVPGSVAAWPVNVKSTEWKPSGFPDVSVNVPGDRSVSPTRHRQAICGNAIDYTRTFTATKSYETKPYLLGNAHWRMSGIYCSLRLFHEHRPG